MRIAALLPTVFIASAAASALFAQEPRILRLGPDNVTPFRALNLSLAEPRAIIGVSTTNGASARDTLGVLVTSVRPGSPADKAGIEEGNRIASINGVSLALASADVGDDQMAGVLSHRLTRELDKLKPGDDVDLRVYASGQTKTFKVKTVAPSDLYSSRTLWGDDRATLGINLAATGSARDSIGVFVMSVEDAGPAAKAGIEEGTRITAINGVDVRGHRSADDDTYVLRTSNISRLEREVSRLKPGDDVDLRVYYNGQYRNVKLKAGRVGDLPHRNRSLTIIGGDNFVIPPFPDRMGISIDGKQIGDNVRRALESAKAGFGQIGGWGRGRVDW